MFLTRLWSELKSSFKVLYLPTFSLFGLVIIARLILSFSNSVAKDGKPPFLHTVCAYAAFVSIIILFFVAVVAVAVLMKRNIVKENTALSDYFASAVSATVVCTAAFGIYIGAFYLLSFDGGYFEYYFENLIPPIGFSADNYGAPFIVWSVTAFVAVIASAGFALASVFMFAKARRKKKSAAIGAFLGVYAAILCLFVSLVLSDMPKAELFTNYLISGNYAHIISMYAAFALSAATVSAIAVIITVLTNLNKKQIRN